MREQQKSVPVAVSTCTAPTTRHRPIAITSVPLFTWPDCVFDVQTKGSGCQSRLRSLIFTNIIIIREHDATAVATRTATAAAAAAVPTSISATRWEQATLEFFVIRTKSTL